MIKVKLNIADVIIQMKSKFSLEQFSKQEKVQRHAERFEDFSYAGKRTPDISIDVKIVDELPVIVGAKQLFITYHPQDQIENWRLLKKGNRYIFQCPLEGKEQLTLVNHSFDGATMYLLPKKEKGRVWSSSDIIYDFLQVMLIHYFAQRKTGLLTHAIGLKDLCGKGLLFAGKSGAGKSTTARLWYKHSKVMILNDDRVIVRKKGERFFIYGSPWHGDFSDYLDAKLEAAPLEKVLFIYHAKKNRARKISKQEAFERLYPSTFPTFWGKHYLENMAEFCLDLIKHVPCYSLGFVKNKSAVEFVRNIKSCPETA